MNETSVDELDEEDSDENRNDSGSFAKSFYDYNPTKGQIENFVNAEFNPFHDVPNEIFSPFLHYSSIPPPQNFEVDQEPFYMDNKLNFAIPDFDKFVINQEGNKFSPNQEKLEQYDTTSDISDNSTSDYNNKVKSNSSSELKAPAGNANDFDEEYLRSTQLRPSSTMNFTPFEIKPSESLKNRELRINPKEKLSEKPSVVLKLENFGMLNTSTYDFSENGNELFNDIHEFNSHISTPKNVNKRF